MWTRSGHFSLVLAPALLLLIVFRYYPTLSAIYHSFTIWEIPQPGEFVGLQNYRTLVDDPVFSKSVSNILKFMLGRPDSALLALIFIGFPAVAGFGFLVILAALQNLSSEVNDAALIDGCSRFRRVFAIDLPAIRGPLALIAILSMNSGMQEFSSMFVLTQGGPANATMSLAFYLYQQGFFYGEQGYATAIGTVLMLITLVFSVIIL